MDHIITEKEKERMSSPRHVPSKRKCRHDEDHHTDEIPKKKPKISKEKDKPVKTKAKSSSKKGCTTSHSSVDRVRTRQATSREGACVAGTGQSSGKVSDEQDGLDAASLQLQLAKEQDEKRKLLSSIEELRNQLATKDKQLIEKDKAKSAENLDASVVSSIKEEFICVICQELFINAYTLPCAHSFCKWCIKEWMKRKGHKDCPMCRKRITSEPFHSLVLDNAVKNLARKLSPSEQKERKEMEEEHSRALENLLNTYPDSESDSYYSDSNSDFGYSTVSEGESSSSSDSSDSDIGGAPASSVFPSSSSDSESDHASNGEFSGDSYDSDDYALNRGRRSITEATWWFDSDSSDVDSYSDHEESNSGTNSESDDSDSD